MSRTAAGKTASVLVNPNAMHTYHYLPDVAAGLFDLGCAEADVEGRSWVLPCAPDGTMRDLVARFSRQVGREIRLAGVPRWAVKTVGVFVPLFREVGEMLYQWDEPFVINDRRFRERFRQEPANANEAVAATVAWAQQHYAAP